MNEYKFYLSKNGGPKRMIEAGWTDAHTRALSRESSYLFLRASIEQPFLFYPGRGWEDITGGSIEDSWTLRIEQVGSGGNTPYFTGFFTWVDCRFNADVKRLEVRLQPDDDYRVLLGNLNTEYNVLDLGLPRVAVTYVRKSLLQIDMGGGQVLHVQDGNAYERRYERTGPTGFWGSTQYVGFVPGDASTGLPASLFGEYQFNPPATDSDELLQFVNSDWTITLFDAIDGDFWEARSGSVTYTSPRVPGNSVRFAEGFEFVWVSYRTRVLTNESSVGSIQTLPIVEGDHLAVGLAYQNAASYTVNGLVWSWQGSEYDAGHGRFADDGNFNGGQFVERPAEVVARILRDKTDYAAAWFRWPPSALADFQATEQEETVNDAYLLSEVLNGVASAASSGRVLHGTADSELLYGETDPISGAANRRLVLIPTSNVTVRGYTNAATIAVTTAERLFNMLYAAKNAYWYVKDGRLKVEHYRHYIRGGTYGTARVGLDLRNRREAVNDLPWEYWSNSWEYDVEQMPERLEFSQGQTVSETFAGQPIVMVSRHAQAGQKEEVRADGFVFDLDYVLTSDDVNERDILVVEAVQQNNGNYRVVLETVGTVGGVQNGSLAMPYVHSTYWREGLPTRRAVLNGQEITADSVRPSKKQTVTMPTRAGDDFTALVRTSMGVGVTESADQNMATGRTEIKLEYEPE